MNTPLVSICSLTYNHAPYIRECLEGFLMQKTDFAFEIIINDDASTDGTTEIIREYETKYPHLIKPIYHEENKYSKGERGFVPRYCLPKAQGKYIALCEGDDYWIDPLKLQKQVDFLERNPEVGAVYSMVQCYYQANPKLGECLGADYISFKNLLKRNVIPTLTVVLRKDLLDRYIREIKPELQNWKMNDYPMWLWFAHESKLHFINEVTGVYRILENSVSHTKSMESKISFSENFIDIQIYFNNLFDGGKSREYFDWKKWLMRLRTYSIYRDFNRFVWHWLKGV